MERNQWAVEMTTEAMFDVLLVPHIENHWDIVSARYENDRLHIVFQDNTSGSIPVSQFPALSEATEADFADLEVSPCGLILENDRIEWDYAEAGLYRLITDNKTEPSFPIDSQL